MKPILSASLCVLVLLGFGCSSASQDANETTYDASPDWWLEFDLPEGWVMTRHYESDQSMYANSAIVRSLTDIVLQSTDKNVWRSAGIAPEQELIDELGGEDQIVSDDYTFIRVVHMTSRNVIPSEAEDLGNGFYRVMLCEDGGECQLGGASNYEYYLETENSKYKFYINQRDQELSAAEEVIFSASEILEAD